MAEGNIQLVLQRAYPAFVLDVALTLPGNGVSVLLGPSGCGKTTLLRAIAGLERARGRVQVNGQVWQDDERAQRFLPTHRRPLAYVFQEASLFAHLDVRRNLDYGLSRVPASERRLNPDEVIELLGLVPLMHRHPTALSGGERQRVAIARALLTSPSLLLMDEPLSALDAARKAEVLPFLERLRGQWGIPMLYVTHALDEATRLADHLVLMREGRVLADGAVADMVSRLDLSLSAQDDAAAVLLARVVRHEPAQGLSQLEVAGQTMWLAACSATPGQTVRVRVQARDVSVSLSRATDSSILNILAARIGAVRHDGQHTVTLSLVLAADVTLLARLTRRSFESLGLRPGLPVFAQDKGAALA
jgi:molybdate transport system ATP-binding protein